jgi:Dolichyl-phosphate-mannose-protein mannosyltransferase
MNETAVRKNRVVELLRLRYLAPPIVLALGAGLFYAHLQIAQWGEDYKGAWMPVDRLFDLTLAFAITAIAFVVGRRAARWLSIDFIGVAEEVTFSVMLGIGIIGMVVFGLGLGGMLAALPVGLSLVVLIALSWREIGALYGVMKTGLRAVTASRLRLGLTIIFCVFVAVLALRALLPPHAYDEEIYHLPATKAFLDEGRIYALVDNGAGNMPFLMQMIYAITLMVKSDTAAKVVSLYVAVVCALALYAFCVRFLSRHTGVVALFAFFAAGMVIEVAITCRVDVSLACMLFMATYAMMVSLETGRRGWLYASALLAGFALGIKHTAAAWILLLGIMYLVESIRRKSTSLAVVIKRGVLYTAITLLVAAPWFIKNQLWFHNPIYPFATGEVTELTDDHASYFTDADEAKLEAHFAEARRAKPEIVEEREAALARAVANRPIQHPPHFWEYFTDPGRYNAPENYHEPNYLFLCVPLVLLLRKPRWVIWLIALSVGFYVLVTQVVWFSRYLLPVYPALTVVAAYVLTGLGEWAATKVESRWVAVAARVLPAAALLAALGPLAFTSFTQLSELRGPEYLTGKLSRREFMKSMFYYQAIDFINRALPPDARVMMIGAQMSYGLQHDYVADTSLDTLGWQRLLLRSDSLAGVRNDLRQQGITHLLVGYSIFPWGASRSGSASLMTSAGLQKSRPDYYVQLRNWATLDFFLSQYAEPIYADQTGYTIYRMR